MRQQSSPNFMYIGPTIISVGLKKNTLYQGEGSMPPQLRSLVQTTPMLASLFVPTARLAAAKESIKTRGSIEFLSAQTLRKMMRGQQKTSN